MPAKDVFKISRKTFFNPSGWLGYGLIKSQFKMTGDIIKDLVTPAQAEREETFKQALARLNLTETDIQDSAQIYYFYALIFVALAAGSFAYGFYLLFTHGTFTGWLLAMSVTALFLSQAFRFDFWRFQIKHRKLGCTFSEWTRGKINTPEDPRV